MMNLETELRELAQTHLDLIQDIQWHDLRRAVVIHLESLEEQDTLIVPRVPTREVCHHIINQKPCPKWTDGTACGATWHPEFIQILEDGQPKWIWMPRQTIYVGPTSDPAGSDTNRVNFVAQTPTAYVHMHPIGSTQNFGPFDGGCNMNSTQVLPPATHSTVT